MMMKSLILTLLVSTLMGQSDKITDANFKKTITKGFVVVKFTAQWSAKKLEQNFSKDVSGYQDAAVVTVASEDNSKAIKKLRIRNFPSVVLFYDGKKKKVWKADMDGKLDLTAKDLKKAIDDVLAGDVF